MRPRSGRLRGRRWQILGLVLRYRGRYGEGARVEDDGTKTSSLDTRGPGCRVGHRLDLAPQPRGGARYTTAPAVENLTDRLFDDATRGERDALDRLLQRYLPQLHAYVHARLGAELRARESSLDVVQSVCRQLLEARGPFDFRGEERFRAWLFTAALNKVRDRHRELHCDKRDVARELEPTDSASVAVHLLTPSQAAIGNETAAAVSASLAALTEEHREVVALARLVRLPHQVIAEVMGRSEPATRQLLARAMVRLTRELRRRGVDVASWNLQ